MVMEQLTESQVKTAKSCYSMYQKWIQKAKPEKGRTPAHYVKACIDGYPNGIKLNPAILKTRLNGIVRFANFNEEIQPIEEKVVTKAQELIKNYREIYKKQ
jgi:hypothetical protein